MNSYQYLDIVEVIKHYITNRKLFLILISKIKKCGNFEFNLKNTKKYIDKTCKSDKISLN